MLWYRKCVAFTKVLCQGGSENEDIHGLDAGLVMMLTNMPSLLRRATLGLVCLATAAGSVLPWGQPVLAAISLQPIPWSEPVLIAGNASAPVIAGDSSGALHLFYVEGWYDTEAGPGNQAVMYQHGEDSAWSAATDVLVSPNGTSIILDGVVIDREGYLQLLWNDDRALYLSTAHIDSASDPRSWQTSTVLEGAIPIADMVLDDSGKLHIVVRSDNFTISYLNLPDQSDTWSEVVRIETVAQPESFAVGGVQLALSSPESIHVTWFQTAAEVSWNFWSVWYARSDDGGQTWSKKEEIATPRFGASDIAVDSAGNVHLVYGRNIGYPDGRWYQWSRDGGDTWSEPALLFPQFEHASGDTGGYGFATDSAGVLHMVNSFGGADGEATAYHLEWQGDHWSSPQLVMEQHAHFPRIVATLGNQLNFVAMAGREYEIWFRDSVVDAPAVAPVPVPQEHTRVFAGQDTAADETPVPVETSPANETDAEASVPVEFDNQQPQSQLTASTSLLLGVLAALLLVIAIVALVQLSKSRRRS